MITRLFRKVTRRARNAALDSAIRLKLQPYRKPFRAETGDWNEDYAVGELDYYGALRELPRYGVLLGYLSVLPDSLSILDVGCGVGLMRSRIRDEQVGRYCGCDPSDVAVGKARALQWVRSEFHVEATPPAALGQFDVIICNEMLYYVDDVDALLARLSGMLKPDGRLLTSVTRHPGDSVLHDKLDRHFARLDAVIVKSKSAPLKWRLACHGKRSDAPC